MSNQTKYVVATVATVGAIGAAYYAYKAYRDTTKIPTEWTQVGTLSDLYLYPIKSVGAITLDSAEITILGLKDGLLTDRTLMVVDDKMNFVTGRKFPELVTVQPVIKNTTLTLKHSEMEDVHLDLAEVVALQKPRKATVWGVTVPVYDCGYEPSEWFSRLLTKTANSLRLVFYASRKSRKFMTSSDFTFYKFKRDDTGAFPDEVSYHLINEASLEDLNTRLESCQVTHHYFRPNFVLRGAKPYEEDNWKFLKIGNSVFEIIKPCTRCTMIIIDPETGVRKENSEPLEILRRYRQCTNPDERKAVGSSPRMGIQMALRTAPGGKVSLNDAIYAA